MKKILISFVVPVFTAAFSAAVAMANGTINATVLYSGQLSPRELFFQSGAGVYGYSDSNGNISVSVPEGTYYVRITRRAGSVSAWGPPYPGDYIWGASNPRTITVTTGGSGGCPSVYGDYGPRTYASSATPWDPAPSCAACICGGQYYANCSGHTGTALCYSDCPVTVTTGQNTVNISW